MTSPIEAFVAQSFGSWSSRRSGHNLAFRHVEEIASDIHIAPIEQSDPQLDQLLRVNGVDASSICCPFRMSWAGSSDWDEDATSSGTCLLAPVPETPTTGRLLRSQGYAEQIPAVGTYRFSDDGTFILVTPYEAASAEERIWFATNDLRLRVSMMRTASGRGVIQASFSSEIRQTGS